MKFTLTFDFSITEYTGTKNGDGGNTTISTPFDEAKMRDNNNKIQQNKNGDDVMIDMKPMNIMI